ncbi:MAG: HAD-IIA family hydrolase [Ilumatobacteraceae bacterium]
MDKPDHSRATVLCDLDGVIWLAHNPISGSVEAVSRLRDAGFRVLFVTNASFQTRESLENDLSRLGIEARGDVLTSAMAAASLVRPGDSVLVCGGDGLHDEMTRRGARVHYAHEVDARSGVAFDAVVAGLYRDLTYEALDVAARAIRAGARFIASNTDPVYPTENGPVPGGGSTVAALAVASERQPEVAGKPHHPMATLVADTCGVLDSRSSWMVGDRHDTDGAFARRLGVKFGHVLSGSVTDTGECAARSRDLWELSSIIIEGMS